jgi:hypothetical protein
MADRPVKEVIEPDYGIWPGCDMFAREMRRFFPLLRSAAEISIPKLFNVLRV